MNNLSLSLYIYIHIYRREAGFFGALDAHPVYKGDPKAKARPRPVDEGGVRASGLAGERRPELFASCSAIGSGVILRSSGVRILKHHIPELLNS